MESVKKKPKIFDRFTPARIISWMRGAPSVATKEYAAARFFVEVFGRFAPEELRKLILDYWRQYRHLDALLEKSGISPRDPSIHLLDIGGGYTTALYLFDTPNRCVLDICVDELVKSGIRLDSQIRWISGPGERVPFPDRSFDAVFCSNALDHTGEPERVVEESHRVLKPEGFFILTVDLFEGSPDSHMNHRDISHPHDLTQNRLQAMLTRFFDVVFEDAQPTEGKVGLNMLAKGRIHPRPDRQEHIYLLKKK
jgi:ubiquinone/menaquinone biosynthesis C-methylase UbiE